MDLAARNFFFGALLSLLAAAPAAAQLSDQLPRAPYYVALQSFYEGDYRDAARVLGLETRRGLRIAQSRWIDSICHHAMLGEVFYHQGRNADALIQFDQACQLLLAYPDWLLQVNFQQPPRPDPNRARRAPPWGRSERQFTLGQFPDTEQVLIGDVNAQQAFRQGGVAALPMMWRVNVAEVVRMSALAIRRRGELLGPLAEHDRISKDLSDTLARGNLAPANHWSAVWIDLMRGITQASLGKLDEADMLLSRAVIIDGQFDHPLTSVVLMEQGRIAMIRGDSRRAAQLLAEAGYSAFYYDNWDVLTESIMLGWLNHLASSGAGIYPPLEPVAVWAQANRLDHIAVKLRLAQAESFAWAGQLDAAAIAADMPRRLGEMRGSLAEIHLMYVQASLQLLGGQLAQGNQMLAQAISVQKAASLRNFRIARTNDMFDAGAISPRVAVDLYGNMLADPAPADWVFQPLDAMAVLSTPLDAAFDRWFMAALDRNELPLALEVAEAAKRRRYVLEQPLGGRLAALRTVLEAPQAQLSRDALLQRQQILTSFPAYRALSDAGQRIYEKLRGGSILPTGPADAKPIGALYSAWQTNVRERERLLAQLTPRRIPSLIEFPPLRTVPQLQQTLVEGDAMVVFHAAAGGLYGFLVTQHDIHLWQIGDLQQLRSGLGEFLRSLGNYGPNRPLQAEDLKSGDWREPASVAFEAIFGDARLDLDKTKRLIIVPDDLLWYLPFDALVAGSGNADLALADRLTMSYGPTAALAVASPRRLRRPQVTGIVANELLSKEAAVTGGDEIIDELAKVVSGPIQLPTPLSEPGYLVAALLDGLISLDEIETQTGAAWSPLPRSRRTGDDGSVFGLPYGGAERLVITGFATAAEQGLRTSRRTARQAARPGQEIFQPLCSMMADGARTILLTRWRTGGRTNIDLVREFLRELPHSPAPQAWQRACLLARESPLDSSREPRLARLGEAAAELPTADHPFFWAGYLLVDTAPRAEIAKKAEPADVLDDAVPNAEEQPASTALPPPDLNVPQSPGESISQ
jgi:CHAT domain